jgi:hypothetical protein
LTFAPAKSSRFTQSIGGGKSGHSAYRILKDNWTKGMEELIAFVSSFAAKLFMYVVVRSLFSSMEGAIFIIACLLFVALLYVLRSKQL